MGPLREITSACDGMPGYDSIDCSMAYMYVYVIEMADYAVIFANI